MALRDFLFGQVVNDGTLNGLGITSDTAFTQHDVDTPQQRPFLTFHWGNTNPGYEDIPFPLVNERDFQVWIHDEPGDYTRIDDAIARVRTVLTGIVGADTGAGWVQEVHWLGDSDDLSDDEQGTITRFGEFRVTGSAA